MNEIFFRTESFEQQCVILNEFLNQGEISAQCSFIFLNDLDFNSQCLSNAKRLFSDQNEVLVSFTAAPHAITTANQYG